MLKEWEQSNPDNLDLMTLFRLSKNEGSTLPSHQMEMSLFKYDVKAKIAARKWKIQRSGSWVIED